MVTEAQVYAVLGDVVHPSFGMSLVELGMVRAVRVEPHSIQVDLVMNCAGCPGPQAAIERAFHAVQTLDAHASVQISLIPGVWRPPWDGLFGY